MENRFMDMGRGEMGGEDLRYEDVADIHNGILHIQKMDQIVPFSETQTDLQTVIQSEVSQKEKDKYRILTHIYSIQKNGTEEFICRAAMEKQTQRIDLRTWERGGEGEMYGESDM